MTAEALRVEHLDHPLGIHTPSPRFSWRLPPGAGPQVAYRIRTDNGWDTGRVDGDRSLLLPAGRPARCARPTSGAATSPCSPS